LPQANTNILQSSQLLPLFHTDRLPPSHPHLQSLRVRSALTMSRRVCQ
jgi:hypothetical protein